MGFCWIVVWASWSFCSTTVETTPQTDRLDPSQDLYNIMMVDDAMWCKLLNLLVLNSVIYFTDTALKLGLLWKIQHDVLLKTLDTHTSVMFPGGCSRQRGVHGDLQVTTISPFIVPRCQMSPLSFFTIATVTRNIKNIAEQQLMDFSASLPLVLFRILKRLGNLSISYSTTVAFIRAVWCECYNVIITSFLPYLIFVIFLHEQNFWRIKFTPKNANFLR